MSDTEKPQARFVHVPGPDQPSATVLPMKRAFPAEKQPNKLSKDEAQRLVRMLAADSGNIVVVAHGRERQRQRKITRPQIERCVQKGVVTEGPFVNGHGNWQINVTRYAAGEEITCVVAIEWVSKLIVITAF